MKQDSLSARLQVELRRPLRLALISRGPDTELLVANPIELCGKGRPMVFHDITLALKMLNRPIFSVLPHLYSFLVRKHDSRGKYHFVSRRLTFCFSSNDVTLPDVWRISTVFWHFSCGIPEFHKHLILATLLQAEIGRYSIRDRKWEVYRVLLDEGEGESGTTSKKEIEETVWRMLMSWE